MTARFYRLLTLALFIGLASRGVAQDDKASEQKKTAMENLNKAGLKKVSFGETTGLILFSSLPETKTKTMADAAEKVLKFAKTALKVEDKDTLWPGKLSVVVLGDQREFASYVRAVTQQRPDGKDWFRINVRGDQPTAAVVIEGFEKLKDSELTSTVSAVVAAAVLNSRAGTSSTTGNLPEWMQTGFGKTMVARSTGGTALTEFRTKSKSVVVGTKSKASPVKLDDLWSVKSKEVDIAAQSFVEYMVYGMDADKFLSFAKAFKLTEQGMQPMIEGALMAVEWKLEEVNLGWRVWVSKQK